MGRLNTILSFIRVLRNDAKVTDVKCDPGGGANTTAEHFSSPGDDSFPLKTDVALTVPRNGSGREAAIGYIDPSSEQKAEEGEKRIYARDDTGAEVADIWLKNDGTIVNTVGDLSLTMAPDKTTTLTNGKGVFKMLANGDFDINGVIITAAGVITSAAGVNLDTHTHAQGNDSHGDTQQETEAPS